MGLYWVPVHARVRGSEIPDKLALSLLDLSHPLGSLGRISVIILNAGWITSIWQCGMVLVVLGDRLEN
jgi:hypothetical protein